MMREGLACAQVNLRTLFLGSLERFDQRPAIVVHGRSHTYGELVDQANRLASALHDRGVGPGVPVALLMSNCVEYVVADLAIIRCGAVKVPCNDMLAASEVDFILRDSGAVVAIADGTFFSTVAESSAPDLRIIVRVGSLESSAERVESFGALLASGTFTVPDVTPMPTDPGLILYTGGTTGRPKGVVHSQHGLAMNLLSHIIEMGLQDDERLLLMSPLPHSAGFILQAGLLKGATHFIESSFDPALVLERVECDRITFTFMVPTMIYRVLDEIGTRSVDTSSIRTILYGAAPITTSRLEQGLSLLGPVFMQLYGQSEAPNFVTRLAKSDHDLGQDKAHRLGSCGQQVLLSEVKIMNEEGSEAGRGEIGEIVVRSPYNMSGYRGLPEKTAEVIRDEWLYTGDIGEIDTEGYIYLRDRKNDMIITGGLNVYSTEVENALQGFPGVSQAAVVGIPHPDWGEAVVAFVVPLGPGAFDDQTLDQYCRSRMSAYKRPKRIVEVSELPMTAYGKVDKKQLRDWWPGW